MKVEQTKFGRGKFKVDKIRILRNDHAIIVRNKVTINKCYFKFKAIMSKKNKKKDNPKGVQKQAKTK